MMVVPYIMCFVGIICLATPIRKKLKACWDQCFADDEKEDDGITYESKALQFTDDYDTTNPLTQKEGKIRLLNTQITSLEAQGEEGKEQAEMLRSQLQFVESSDNKSAMQNFVQQNHMRQVAYMQAYNPAAAMMAQQNAMQQQFMRQQMIRQQMQMNYMMQQQRQMHLMQAMQNQQFMMNRMGVPVGMGGQVGPMANPHQAQMMAARQRQMQMQMQMS